ncbi:MAG: DHH family phosphoesterase [Candidatus Methanomethylophilaceae archaeon]|nr:DHH family phosphoesterase [Candidatus Methanomethylophilaceae archaeon]
MGIEHSVRFETKLTAQNIGEINSSEEDAVWVCDLGSGYLSEFRRGGMVVTDHHVPDPRWRRRQTTLEDFNQIVHINPHCYGMDGSYETCGAGMTYVLSKTLDDGNTDLAFLAIVGAVGDFQDSHSNGLVGFNREILKDAVIMGDVEIVEDLRMFGRDTRPVNTFLQYSTEPRIPGLSENPYGCEKFLDSLGVRKDDGRWPSWNGLEPGERDVVREAVLDRLSESDLEAALGEVYTLPRFPVGSGLRDAKEFATALNSCGRYDDAGTGLRICKGDADAKELAENNRANHRRNISTAMGFVRDNHLIRERRFIQYFDAGPNIKETVVGIVTGMVLNSDLVHRRIPTFGFAEAEDGLKVSRRTDKAMADRGLDLSVVMNTAANLVGGYGGGHSVAAGATIPPEKKKEFLDIVEDLVSSMVD